MGLLQITLLCTAPYTHSGTGLHAQLLSVYSEDQVRFVRYLQLQYNPRQFFNTSVPIYTPIS